MPFRKPSEWQYCNCNGVSHPAHELRWMRAMPVKIRNCGFWDISYHPLSKGMGAKSSRPREKGLTAMARI